MTSGEITDVENFIKEEGDMGDYTISGHLEEYALYYAIGGIVLLTAGLSAFFGVRSCNKNKRTVEVEMGPF